MISLQTFSTPRLISQFTNFTNFSEKRFPQKPSNLAGVIYAIAIAGHFLTSSLSQHRNISPMPRKLEKHHKNQRLGGGCNQAMEEDDSDPFREQDPNSPRAEEQLQSTPDGPGDEEEEDDDEEEEEYNEDEDDQSSLIKSSHVKRNDSSVSGSSKTFSKSKKKANRCEVCRKKVGLTGFTCRCGGLYCALHRYSDKHECDFDYKKLGAEEIRKNNPVIEGEKIHKI